MVAWGGGWPVVLAPSFPTVGNVHIKYKLVAIVSKFHGHCPMVGDGNGAGEVTGSNLPLHVPYKAFSTI